MSPATVLVAVAIGVGLALFAGAYAALHGEPAGVKAAGHSALDAPSGVAGVAMFLGLGAIAFGAYLDGSSGRRAGRFRRCRSLGGRTGPGVRRAAVRRRGSAPPARSKQSVELLDTVLQLGCEPPFLRPACRFRPGPRRVRSGLVWHWGDPGPLPTRAVLGWLWGAPPSSAPGNAVAFTLEALVAAVQALAPGVLRAVLPACSRTRAGRSGPGTSPRCRWSPWGGTRPIGVPVMTTWLTLAPVAASGRRVRRPAVAAPGSPGRCSCSL